MGPVDMAGLKIPEPGDHFLEVRRWTRLLKWSFKRMARKKYWILPTVLQKEINFRRKKTISFFLKDDFVLNPQNQTQTEGNYKEIIEQNFKRTFKRNSTDIIAR